MVEHCNVRTRGRWFCGLVAFGSFSQLNTDGPPKSKIISHTCRTILEHGLHVHWAVQLTARTSSPVRSVPPLPGFRTPIQLCHNPNFLDPHCKLFLSSVPSIPRDAALTQSSPRLRLPISCQTVLHGTHKFFPVVLKSRSDIGLFLSLCITIMCTKFWPHGLHE